MHDSVKTFLRDIIAEWAIGARIAEIGSYNLNGSIKEIWPASVGFDVVKGPGVDVVIEPGKIPDAFKNRYQVVICTSALVTAGNPQDIFREASDLAVGGGLLVLTTCVPGCTEIHSSSPGTKDERYRPTWKEIVAQAAAAGFSAISILTLHGEHEDLVYIGRKL